jgi:hypothetical protein
MTSKAKATAVAKPAKAAKTAAPSRQKLQQEITSLRKQISSSKHGGGSKKGSKHAAKGTAKHSAKRGLARIPGDAECCVLQAFAESLRHAGRGSVSDSELLAIHSYLAGGPRAALSIRAAAEALLAEGCHHPAQGGEFGEFASAVAEQIPVFAAVQVAASETGVQALQHAAGSGPSAEMAAAFAAESHGLILGVDLPGPHAVFVAPDGTWWSWGEPFNPEDWPGLAVDEAWAVTWR